MKRQPYTKIEPAMLERIHKALRCTWDAIGDDILQGNERKNVRRSVVIEVTLDADHVRSYGDDKEASELLYSLPYNQMIKIAREAFPYQWYGY